MHDVIVGKPYEFMEYCEIIRVYTGIHFQPQEINYWWLLIKQVQVTWTCESTLCDYIFIAILLL